jgi:uncharacterized protein
VKVKTLLLSAPFRLLWTIGLFIGLNAVLNWLDIAPTGRPESFTWIYRNAVVALGVFWFSVRLLEGKRLHEAGLDPRHAPAELVAGFGVGTAGVSTIIGALALVGAYRIDGLWPIQAGTTRLGWFGFTVVALFLVGFAEELRNRGILFRLLEQNLGTWIAVALSALAFGFAHWKNPGATLWSSLAIALEGGVLLAALYAATRSLWIPIGIHWAWNLLEGPVFGAAVSGNSVGALARGVLTGPTWLTGGEFGPEAGLPALIVGGVLGGLAIAWMIRRGEVRPPPWVRSRQPEPASVPSIEAPPGEVVPGPDPASLPRA